MSLFTYPAQSINTTGLATEAKQDDIITGIADVNSELDSQSLSLSAINTKVATETTLALVEAKDFSTETTLSALNTKVTAVDTTGKATEAKQDNIIAELQDIEADIEAGNVSLASIDSKVATEATLAQLDGKVTAVDTTGKSTEAKQDTMITSLSAIESDIDNLNARLAGNLVPETFDFLQLSYVAAGNGAGEIETVTYKAGGGAGTTVATLTLGYDAQNRLTSVTRS